MNQEEELLETVGEAVEYAKQYTKDQIQLLKLELAERTAKLISTMATSLVIFFILMTAILFMTLSLAFLIGSRLDSNAAGFAIVAGIYVVAGILINIFKKPVLTNPILSVVIRQLFD